MAPQNTRVPVPLGARVSVGGMGWMAYAANLLVTRERIVMEDTAENLDYSYKPTAAYDTGLPKPWGIVDQLNSWASDLNKIHIEKLHERDRLQEELEAVQKDLLIISQALNGISFVKENRV